MVGTEADFASVSYSVRTTLVELGYGELAGDHSAPTSESFMTVDPPSGLPVLEFGIYLGSTVPLGSFDYQANADAGGFEVGGIGRRSLAGVWFLCNGVSIEVLSEQTTDVLPAVEAIIENASCREFVTIDTIGLSEVIEPRYGHAGVWTGTEMIVWGGTGEDFRPLASGAALDPETGEWQALPPSPLTPRTSPSGVWTGTELLIWGGAADSGATPSVVLGNGASYDPATRSWARLPAAPLAARVGHSVAWTGSEMLIWGGASSIEAFGSGARYNPVDRVWVPMADAPLAARVGHSVVWTGSEMIVWGGRSWEFEWLDDGAAYNPSTDTWRTIATPGQARQLSSAVWTGSDMLVWGGSRDFVAAQGGLSYNPTTDTWTRFAQGPLDARAGHAAIWTGSEMLVWGGSGEGDVSRLRDGAAYTPNGGWALLPEPPIEFTEDRLGFTVIWTETSMVIWGGGDEALADGAAFIPSTRTWSYIPAPIT